MRLYLLRHGDSEHRAETDAQRQLTPQGRLQALDISLQFTSKGLKLDRCLVSPFTRAIQTADSFLSRVEGAPGMEIVDFLTPEIRALEAMNQLELMPDDESILLVSHNPLVTELNAVLVEGNIDNLLIMETCEMSVIDIDIVGTGMGRRQMSILPHDV